MISSGTMVEGMYFFSGKLRKALLYEVPSVLGIWGWEGREMKLPSSHLQLPANGSASNTCRSRCGMQSS